uniref:Uncharacterized protein n=1 Tax=Arundo donax TaxID=35708 RepID=A0A0A9A483_ARUDO
MMGRQLRLDRWRVEGGRHQMHKRTRSRGRRALAAARVTGLRVTLGSAASRGGAAPGCDEDQIGRCSKYLISGPCTFEKK